MTEAGKRWLTEQTGEASSFDVAEAEFWIKLFCQEVERRAVVTALEQTGDTGDPTQWLDWSDWLAGAFTKLKRELLGE